MRKKRINLLGNDQFILKNQDECTSGSSFYSNVDLTDMKISNPKGSNRCE